jgi:phage terminase large subunit
MACLFRLHLAAMDNPGIRCLVVRKTARSLGSTTLVTFRERVATEALAKGLVTWFGGNAEEAAAYRYWNGSVIVVGGLDKPEKVMSAEYDLIFADEATELVLNDWELLGTRLRHGVLAWQQQIAACNPAHPTHWIKLRAETGALTMLESRHEDNPRLFRDGQVTDYGTAYLSLLDSLTGVRYLRLRKGIWAAAEGVIYEEWDPAVHLVDRFDIPSGWMRWWVVDFGYVHPFVLQWWAEDYDGRLYLYREIYRTHRLVEDHARDALAIVAPGGEWVEPRPRAVICDHDAEDRATLERHLGMATIPARKDVSPGIQAVQSRLRPVGDGRRRLYVVRDSVVERDPELDEAKRPASTAEEITGYVWLPPSPGRAAKEQPLKENDDGCDTMRYMVAARDLGDRAPVVSPSGVAGPSHNRVG